MKAPDKIYLPIVQGRTRKDIRYDATYFAPTEFAEENIEYIRKEALLEWLESVVSLNLFAIEGVGNDYQHGKNDAYQHIIDKLNSI